MKPKPEKLRPYSTPFSPYALFQIALRGFDLHNVATGAKVLKYEVWEQWRDRPDIIERIKERKESRYTYVKNS